MIITFILPRYLNVPAGGFKVVYEYANSLQARGHRVTVVHPRNVTPQYGWTQSLKSCLWSHKIRWRDGKPIAWFPIRYGVKMLYRIAMMAHTFDWKETPDGLTALETVRKQIPELEAVLFGTHRPPANMPEWIKYLHLTTGNTGSTGN
jgi:hypothetical protein